MPERAEGKIEIEHPSPEPWIQDQVIVLFFVGVACTVIIVLVGLR